MNHWARISAYETLTGFVKVNVTSHLASGNCSFTHMINFRTNDAAIKHSPESIIKKVGLNPYAYSVENFKKTIAPDGVDEAASGIIIMYEVRISDKRYRIVKKRVFKDMRSFVKGQKMRERNSTQVNKIIINQHRENAIYKLHFERKVIEARKKVAAGEMSLEQAQPILSANFNY